MLNYQVIKTHDHDHWIVLLHGLGGNSSIWYKQKNELSQHFNLLFVDLHGHGESELKDHKYRPTSLDEVSKDVVTILDNENIENACFMGVSLGSIIARHIAIIAPERVRCLILCGSVLYFNIKSRILLELANINRYFLDYMNLYKLFSKVIMPKKNHEKSRSVFIREAKKLQPKDFLFWFHFLKDAKSHYHKFKMSNIKLPSLHILGNEDHIFIKTAKKEAEKCVHSSIKIIEDAGHLCNIDSPNEYNKIAVDYIRNHFS
ncbi:alpha/beta fold hydrolase [Texcoconibacillus texcoconensis]|uniref:Pimeloyl-ACP methyl ester carboxylesterase n=1 Tax=Texcoconibacillus texcoconensis TaxID=1095777 RepID=A0A840QT41_9BACI|nr:alpha/beta hydrolase [Texcoconibacillus texcoconensis]MBB5174451.1 pimeloyl-ACP methyl ester carboxylesterase [Texcoconibacillus texcoconensis]